MEPYVKSLRSPDETLRLPGLVEEMVDLGDLTVGRAVTQPGWRWSKDLRPLVGGQWCQARHVGVLLSGRLGFLMANGVELSVGPDDVYDIPPGHDGYALGDEPVVALEWSGLRALAGSHRGPRYRELVTLLLTDIVQSTPLAARLGDHAWGSGCPPTTSPHGPSSTGSGARRSPRRATGSSRRSPAPPAPWPVLPRSGGCRSPPACTCAPASTSGRSSGWAPLCAGWPSTR